MPDRYFSAGYYVARPLPPAELLSGSSELCAFFPDIWAIGWATSVNDEQRARSAAHFGLSATEAARATEWATESFGKTFGWPNAFYTLEAAREARREFLSSTPEIVVFGLALRESDVDCFLRAAEPPPQQPGYAPIGESGVFQCVKAARPIEAGGQSAGFEILMTHGGLLTTSWRSGVFVLNERGLVPSYDEASGCASTIAADGRSGPGLWLPWLVTIYPA